MKKLERYREGVFCFARSLCHMSYGKSSQYGLPFPLDNTYDGHNESFDICGSDLATLQLPLSITKQQLSEDKFDPDTDQVKRCYGHANLLCIVPCLGLGLHIIQQIFSDKFDPGNPWVKRSELF